MRSALLVLVVGALVGCSDPFSPADLIGDWQRETEVPGVAFVMTLAVDGSSINGSGQSCGEALACTPVTVAGTVVGNEVRLDIAYEDSRIEHFVGHVLSGQLRGYATMTEELPVLPPGGAPYPVGFERVIGLH